MTNDNFLVSSYSVCYVGIAGFHSANLYHMPINHYACTENHLNADHLINIICCVVFSAVGLVVVVVVDFTACLVLTEAEIACNEINE